MVRTRAAAPLLHIRVKNGDTGGMGLNAGAIIGQSLRLSPADLGISILPLHHVGGIACNLIAPLLLELSADLSERVEAGGSLIISGVLRAQEQHGRLVRAEGGCAARQSGQPH